MILKENDINSVKQSTKILKNGGIIAFATDTVYGLACDALNNEALERLYKLKNRKLSNPIAIFVESLEIAQEFVEFNKKSIEIANNFMPGALTLVLKKRENNFSSQISRLLSNDSYIGIRIPNHKFSLELLKSFNGILAVTSANISNQVCAKNVDQIKDYFKNDLDLIIDGGELNNKASTVVRIIDDKVEILRHGAINLTKDNRKD